MAEWSPPEALDILVVGNTSTGKSALINKMVEKDGVAKEADDEQCKETLSVKDHVYSIEGFTGKIWDTPGLQDGTEDDDDVDDAKHISDMKKGGFDKTGIMLYCIKLSNTRFQPEDRETIINLTKGLGNGIWERAIFVLTFANEAIARLERKDKYRPLGKPVHEVFKDDVISTWKKVLHKEVKNAGVSAEVAVSIPVVPAGYELDSIEKLYLENGNNWIESLWHECKARKPPAHDSTISKKAQKLFTSVADSLGSSMASLGSSVANWVGYGDREGAHEQTTSEAERGTGSSTKATQG